MILPNRGASVDRNRRSKIRKSLKSAQIIKCIESLMAANELRLMAAVTIVTTLLDNTLYPAKVIAELYGLRWDIEIDIGCFKTTMAQGELRCLTPQNIDREIAVSILAYNIVRLLTNDVAHVASLHPREISFSHSRDAWKTYGREIETAYDLMWIIHAACSRFVRDRPGRQEPREIKKRHMTKYPTLKKPRPSRMRLLINGPSPPLPAP